MSAGIYVRLLKPHNTETHALKSFLGFVGHWKHLGENECHNVKEPLRSALTPQGDLMWDHTTFGDVIPHHQTQIDPIHLDFR